MNSSFQLDSMDWKIVDALQHDARQSLSALGKRIGLSQPAISERIRKLEDAGVIEGYGARLNLQKLGYGLQAMIRLRSDHARLPQALKQCEAMPEVLEVLRITGEDCLLIRCVIPRPEALQTVVDALAAHGNLTTSLVLSTPIARPVARLDTAEPSARQ
ncbi:Lrp/AsnC family transcriptional regulator [Jeongeupia naejangsanensis]|uniref:Lrp/AsnC family transcriptional regulator n=1 Tax=Jeongeupia naejangsanensis TaxID=613195 RepID=A0ABS2BPY5_9NEIS|nr:Lrp/AsnC family transcriptional regulator [Jeongeupia naejangsanensis]MBM3117663.1 Lrp/AsnC family transcriptional regulator [Jeongeupia naejangsanensis]